jgi:hypothetical protein
MGWKYYFAFFLQIYCMIFLHYTRLDSHLAFVIVIKLLYAYYLYMFQQMHLLYYNTNFSVNY